MKLLGIWVASFSLMSLMVSPASADGSEQPLWKDDSVQESLNQSCTAKETQCRLGCCPFPDAECCSSGYECCPRGNVCIPSFSSSICIGAESARSLTSSEPAYVRGLVGRCPRSTTTCEDSCCPHLDATCCNDGRRCCPYGYSCDVSNKKCVKNFPFQQFETGENELEADLPVRRVRPLVRKVTQAVPKHFFKACPGSDHACPRSQNCCVGDAGEWSCCPKPSKSVSSTKSCCETVWGHWCCEEYHLCTLFGCI